MYDDSMKVYIVSCVYKDKNGCTNKLKFRFVVDDVRTRYTVTDFEQWIAAARAECGKPLTDAERQSLLVTKTKYFLAWKTGAII